MQDREQFRRYAEAALMGTIASGLKCPDFAQMQFNVATSMMLAEDRYWEEYQLKALEAIVDDERARHDA